MLKCGNVIQSIASHSIILIASEIFMIFAINPIPYLHRTSGGQAYEQGNRRLSREQVRLLHNQGISGICELLSSEVYEDPVLLNKLGFELEKVFAKDFEAYDFNIEVLDSSIEIYIDDVVYIAVSLNRDEKGQLGLKLSGIDIEPEFRGQSFGTALIGSLEKAAKKSDLNYLQVDSSVNNRFWDKKIGMEMQENILSIEDV